MNRFIFSLFVFIVGCSHDFRLDVQNYTTATSVSCNPGTVAHVSDFSYEEIYRTCILNANLGNGPWWIIGENDQVNQVHVYRLDPSTLAPGCNATDYNLCNVYLNGSTVQMYVKYDSNTHKVHGIVFEQGSFSSPMASTLCKVDRTSDSSVSRPMSSCPITTCCDGTCSNSTGSGTCSSHGGICY